MLLVLNNDAKYDLVVPTSMGVRITPINYNPVYCSDTFIMQATSAETNVASILSYLGMHVKVLTKFVKDSPIAAFIKNNLRSRGIDFEGLEVEQGGPWGFRHQFNIADMGFGQRAPRVYNDRSGEVGCTLQIHDFNLQKIFKTEGVKILHLSGLIAALSPQTADFCCRIVEIAKKYNSIVSFDLNYRESFWKNREKELQPIFKNIALQSDILFGNTNDFNQCFGLNLENVNDTQLEARVLNYQKSIEFLREEFTSTKIFATGIRESLSSNKHMWGAIITSGNNWYSIDPRPITVFDRIGGGDAFVGGILYGLVKEWDIQKCAQFGWACGVLAVTLSTDYAQPLNEEQIWDIWNNDARIKR